MDKIQTVLVVAESPAGIAGLTTGAASLGEKTVLICSKDSCQAVRVNMAYLMGDLDQYSLLNYIPDIIKKVEELSPQLVLTENTQNGRLLAAAIAAKTRSSALVDLTELSVSDGRVIGKRLVYGGAAVKTEAGTGDTVVVCINSNVWPPQAPTPVGRTEELGRSGKDVRLVERRAKEVKTVDLNSAKIVVGVGRGFGSKENISLARALAQTLGGEVGCSRPVAEEEKWMPKEAYVGISGVMIKPDIYFACGISGQVQHMTGVAQARTIVAINKDRNAPIFEKCDYGIVGDLKTILPALTQRLKECL